jgi:flavodoxin I
MKIMIVCDSVFGNTMKIAKAIAESLKENDVVLCKPQDAEKEFLQNADALIVGSPTRAFKPTKNITKFLKALSPSDIAGKKALIFDTRISAEDTNSKAFDLLEKRFGYAGDSMSSILTKKGAKLVVAHEGFYVEDSEGPLKDGEIERAKMWAENIL